MKSIQQVSHRRPRMRPPVGIIGGCCLIAAAAWGGWVMAPVDPDVGVSPKTINQSKSVDQQRHHQPTSGSFNQVEAPTWGGDFDKQAFVDKQSSTVLLGGQNVDCACGGQYNVGDVVRLLVNNPDGNVQLLAGAIGTVVCGTTLFPGVSDILIAWEGINNGHAGNGVCVCPTEQLPPGSTNGWYVACSQVELATPLNDKCEDALPITCGEIVSGTTIGATGVDITFCTFNDNPDVWYAFTAPASGQVTASTCHPGTDYDTALAAFDACGGNELACNDDAVGAPPECSLNGLIRKSRITFGVIAGEEYLIRVSGFNSITGEFELSVPCGDFGACCNCDGLDNTFEITTADECDDLGGDYLGDETSCDDTEPLTYWSGAVNIAIPDNTPAGITSTITVPDSFVAGDVNVGLSIDHTWVGDLCVTLTHGGTTVNLIQRPGTVGGCHQGSPFGCSQDNYVGVVLDDEGTAGPIELYCAFNRTSPPYYLPNELLAAFDGMDAAGDWTLSVSDNADGDSGTLVSWSLEFQAPVCDVEVDCSSCPGDLNGDGFVNVSDLLALLGVFGACPGCPADLNDDGLVNVSDLLALLGVFGACPEPPPAVCDDPFVCGGPIPWCDDAQTCLCVELFGSEHVCTTDWGCTEISCAVGNCPPDHVCVRNSCCGDTTCMPVSHICDMGTVAGSSDRPNLHPHHPTGLHYGSSIGDASHLRQNGGENMAPSIQQSDVMEKERHPAKKH